MENASLELLDTLENHEGESLREGIAEELNAWAYKTWPELFVHSGESGPVFYCEGSEYADLFAADPAEGYEAVPTSNIVEALTWEDLVGYSRAIGDLVNILVETYGPFHDHPPYQGCKKFGCAIPAEPDTQALIDIAMRDPRMFHFGIALWAMWSNPLAPTGI